MISRPVSSARPVSTVENAMSVASRPVAMRTRVGRGANLVASQAYQRFSISVSTTAWKSIGDKPGA